MQICTVWANPTTHPVILLCAQIKLSIKCKCVVNQIKWAVGWLTFIPRTIHKMSIVDIIDMAYGKVF